MVLKQFNSLTTLELYQLLHLRNEVFVVEQTCPYQDLDYHDQKALHLLMTQNQTLIGYARIFGPSQYFTNASIGRVIIKATHRNRTLGQQLMQYAITSIKNQFNTSQIEISAQSYLRQFYQNLGFQTIGNPYLEDNIPHIKMIKTS